MSEEPIYSYIPGKGWISGYDQTITLTDHPCEILDKRLHVHPGRYKYQVWLVGIESGGGYLCEFKDWVDNWHRSWDSLDEVIIRVD